MVFAHSLLRGNVAEHVTLLLIASSHASWTRSTLLRYKLLEFFSSLLGGNEYEDHKEQIQIRNRIIAFE
jgi:hypothetical protein